MSEKLLEIKSLKVSAEDKEILKEVNEHLRTMRDTWKEVMKTANK